MRFLYSLLSYIVLPFALLKLAKNHKLARFSERMGWIKPIQDQVIWIHCVSVGEFLAAKILIDELLKQHKILITVTTKTASDAVLKNYQNQLYHQYFPFDCPLIIKRYIRQIKPKMVLILETEIWVNLVHYLHKNQIPTLLINARLSEKSLQTYQKWMPKLTQQTLNKFNLIAAQNQNSAERFIKLGAKNTRVKVVGNIKFDQNLSINADTTQALKTIIGTRKVVAFASTHAGEEKQIIKAYLKQKSKIDALLLIIPRHPERFNEVYKLAQKQGIYAVKRSSMQSSEGAQMLLGDSMGEMMSYFAISDIVFMGGSLSNSGGHNMLEPCGLAKPILFGKNVFNFAEISADLLSKKAAIQVQNADELFEKISTLLNNENALKVLGKNAQQYFKSKQGVVNNLIQQIKLFL